MNVIRLQFPNRERNDLVLGPGVHVLGRGDDGLPALVDDAERGVAQFSIDPRGIWLQVRDNVRGVHVNGRPIRHMAMLRMGDTLHIDGFQLELLGPEPAPAPEAMAQPTGAAMVLRGVGGPHHGRSLVLDGPLLVGRQRACEVCIDEPGFAERHARLEPGGEGIVLRDLGSEHGSRVNGWPVRHALLTPGTQVAFANQHRFVVEAATMPPPAFGLPEDPAGTMPPRSADGAAIMPRSARRIPWLLLAALLLAGALSLLLLYGAG
ncbi:FHA domain-containing protein [Marilutibacter alkalisoli]|uniref:FHA domain-containing protein n=1 Tax=Marilutibacter alkalisoli TaxID=2591633 RepID=A0A514BRX2_9GAMM|nr:FHA domain-containing protein [Lysobacter alkalisoli]QDH70131.1 FHA domain-containing protein [Lysobacter alkalisoli]